ncbi:unnamed protein product [Tilletia laevis]|uniref:Uncharacterized protein n=1 Tax=Tilletia laevis TaxID=157183 RepID=A0A9N8QDC6_9BASI|nr:hypothetical protein CF336_g3961 [Tilletia laevis]CAD6902846.1 unnamed protein product [Tilletia laevis]CAD6930288.1 unnamed protein product [Tilletia laevis]CAD7068530.1 unnamed protein product [Tilletia caries]
MWLLLRAAADESNVLTPFIAWSVFPVIGTAVALRFAYSTRFIAQPKKPLLVRKAHDTLEDSMTSFAYDT